MGTDPLTGVGRPTQNTMLMKLPRSATAPMELRVPLATGKVSANQALVREYLSLKKSPRQYFTKRQPCVLQQFVKERTTIIFIQQVGK